MTTTPRDSTVSTLPSITQPSQAEWSMFMWCLSLIPILVLVVGVPDDDVGVAARGDDPLLRVHAEHPRRRGAARLDPALERQLAGDDALVDQLHAVLDTADAVGDRGEVADAQLLLVLHAERAVVGADTTASSFIRRPFHRSP